MNSQPTLIRIPGLTKLDKLELSDLLDSDSISFEDQPLPGGKHGELATTAVIIISVAALQALTYWILKARKGMSFRKTVEIVDQNGQVRKETIEYQASSSEAPEASILKQLAVACGVDLNSLLKSKD